MKLHKKRRIAFFTTILVICTACIGITISIQMNNYYENEISNDGDSDTVQLYEIDQGLFRNKFINSFNNKLNGEFNNIKRIDEAKEIIYTESIIEKIENKYDLNTNIPTINIDNEHIKKYNDEINNLFKAKIGDIKKSNIETIYTVDYMANINKNILSIAIKATLKEGNNSQRLILKTFNYDLEKEKEVKLDSLLSQKNLKVKDVQDKIKVEIQKQNKQSLELKSLGYNVFIRDITDEMFKIENINTYFIDSDGYIYIIYAYGNNNLTTEMDIIVF